jgi:hypothetical protein
LDYDAFRLQDDVSLLNFLYWAVWFGGERHLSVSIFGALQDLCPFLVSPRALEKRDPKSLAITVN